MTVTLERGRSGIPLLPVHPRRLGPVSRFLVLRLVIALGVLQTVGAVLVFAVGGDRPTALGLSLVLPGGGFLFAASPELFVLSVAFVALAFVLWWGISAHFAIPLVWAVGVVLAVIMGDGGGLFTSDGTTWDWAVPVVYALAILTIVLMVLWFERKFRRKLALVPSLNEYLDTVALPQVIKPTLDPDERDATALSWAYDLALQPLGDLVGFDWGEQIHGPTCVRYQIDFLGWALAQYTANYVPNAPHVAERAMRNLIEKLTDLRVWRYWRTLNLIGNFDANPDPIVRENIMLSAFTLNLVNIYEAATGSTYFDSPGSLTFVWSDGRTFAYDHHTLADAVLRNYQDSRLGFFPCEPGWAFTACNTIGAEGLYGYDTMHDQRHWKGYEDSWRRTALEEYAQPDGLFPHIKSTKVGLSFDTGEVPGGEYPTTGLNAFADIAPDLAARAGALALRGVDEKMAALEATMTGGALPITMPLTRERNLPIHTAVPEWTRVVGGARAVGRFDLAAAAKEAMWLQCATGESWPGRPLTASVQSIAINLSLVWGMPMNTAALNIRGYAPPTGPLLGETPWPEVLVTKARSSDGVSLDIALRPNRDAPVVGLALTFAHLRPGGAYTFDGQAVKAGADGTATITIDLVEPMVASLELDYVA
jgi:Linalool dehydratase/isomerase